MSKKLRVVPWGTGASGKVKGVNAISMHHITRIHPSVAPDRSQAPGTSTDVAVIASVTQAANASPAIDAAPPGLLGPEKIPVFAGRTVNAVLKGA